MQVLAKTTNNIISVLTTLYIYIYIYIYICMYVYSNFEQTLHHCHHNKLALTANYLLLLVLKKC